MTLQYKQSKTSSKYVSNHLVLGLLLVLFAAGFLLPHNAQAAITHVQSANISSLSSVTTLSKAFTSNNTAGDLIIVWVGWQSSITTAAVTDSAGNVYQPLSIVEFLNIPLRAQIFYARNILAGANTVTLTLTGPDPDVTLSIHEYAGVDPVNPLDGEARLNNLIAGTNAQPQSGSVTTTQASDLLFGVAYDDRSFGSETWTEGSGWALRQSNSMSGTEDMIATSTGSYSATFTVSIANNWVGEIAAFKAAVGRLQVSSRSDTLSNSQPSSTSNHAFTFTVNSAITGSSTLALAFPSQFTFNPGISFVQSAHNSNSCAGSLCSATFTSPNIAGNLIVVSAGIGSTPGRTASIIDTEGNSYATAVGPIANGPAATRYIWYAKNINGGANTVKVTWSNTANFDLEIHEYSGADQTSPLDATSSTIGTGTLFSGTATTTVSNELIFGYGVNDNGETEAGAGFLFREGGNGNGSEDKAAGSGGPYNVTFTDEVSIVWGVLVATFKPASASQAINCGDVDAATSVQFSFNYPSCAATATAWGFSAVNSVITLTAPTVSLPNVYVATGTPITINIGSNATQQQQGGHWITNPSTAGIYTISVGGTFGGSGNILVSINSAVTVQVAVAESLAFTVSSVKAVNCTADDGATVSAVDTSPTSVPLGTLFPVNTFFTGCQDLVVSTNAGNGYSVTVQEQTLMHTLGGFTFPQTACDGAACTLTTAAAWTNPANNGFGHTCFNQDGNHDCASTYSSGTKFRPTANVAAGDAAETIMSSSTPATVTARIKYRISAGIQQAAGTYTTVIVYTITPTY